jgi:hypothetical protein
VRIRLKGVNSITKKLADGTRRTYWYAWKGGPAIIGEPGTPEFIHSYNEAIATKAATPQGALLSVLQGYQASGEFNGLAARTRFDYVKHIKAIPVGAPLKAALDAATKHGPLILTNSLRRPWTSHGFQASWRIAATKAGIVGVTFHDLRGTAVTRLAVVECTEAQIAAITGHSLRDVRSILDANYLHRDPALGESAIRKLERGRRD